MLDFELIQRIYAQFPEKLTVIRRVINRPLTLTEKILYTHVDVAVQKEFTRGEDYVNFQPDRVIMQDVTGQMAILQFMQSGQKKIAVPSSVHCDHLVLADNGAKDDLRMAKKNNKEVYDFLRTASQKYGMDYWQPGAGIIHQVALENYAFPGGLMIGTDSHTPNGGGLGMLAIGVGGADASDTMAGFSWELKFPQIIGVKLTGSLNGWASAKDVILTLVGMLTVKGGTDAIIEYFGEGAESISATGKATICNMGAEVGATTSVFAYDENMADYLRHTGRANVAELANELKADLQPDKEVIAHPELYFDRVITLDLNTIEPHINGPFTPDRAYPISKFVKAVKENNWPEKITVGLIGSCTNSSYQDITRSASIVGQMDSKGLSFHSEFTLTPGSEQIYYTAKINGILDKFTQKGTLVFANACGPCIGQWKRHDHVGDNSIVSSFNRNFAKRNDGNPKTHAFVASPELVTALAIAGRLTFNPLTDTLQNDKGKQVSLDPPQGINFPEGGFKTDDNGLIRSEVNPDVEIVIDPVSDRLQVLTPFAPNTSDQFTDLFLLIKTKGKTTTDHISMAGPWLKYRGHLDNISNNLLINAVNAFNGKTDTVKNQLTGMYESVPKVQRDYKSHNRGSVIVGEENYGEGSSREHAALEPRFLGVKVVLVKSFARIHETNLKKQGMLAITFVNFDDYNKVQEDDLISIEGLDMFILGKNLTVHLKHSDDSTDMFSVHHTYNEEQIRWFIAGSSLNTITQSKQCEGDTCNI